MKKIFFTLAGIIAAIIVLSAVHDLSVSQRTWHDLEETMS